MALKVGELVAFAKLDDAGFASGVRGIEQNMQKMQSATSSATASVEHTVVSGFAAVADAIAKGVDPNEALADLNRLVGGFDSGMGEMASDARTGGQGVVDALKSSLNDAKTIATDAGKDAGQGLARGLDDGLGDAERVARKHGEDTGKEFGDGTEESGKSRMAGVGNKLGAIFAGLGWLEVGAEVGARLMEGLTSAMAAEDAVAKLSAQVGAFGPRSAELGKVAGQVYADAYGESMGDVTEAIKSVVQNIGGMDDASSESLKNVSEQAMNVATVLGEEVGPVTEAVSQMLRTGLAKNAQEAFDILVKGAQEGVNKSEDLLDTFNEYSTKFRDIGLDGKQALGLLSQGLQGGARDADIVADALKEFAIRARDGSDTSAAAFTAIGMSAKGMTEIFAKGGPKSAEALDLVISKIQGIEDPVKRNAVGVALFGTQFEDLGNAFMSLDPSTAAAALGQVGGAAKAAGDELGDTASNKITAFKRSLEQNVVQFIGGTVLPGLESLWAGFQNSEGAGKLGEVFVQVRDVISQVFSSIQQWVTENQSTIQAWADAIQTGMSTMMSAISSALDAIKAMWDVWGGTIMNALGSIISGLLGAWNGLWEAIGGVFEVFAGIFTGDWSRVWNGLKSIVSGVWNALFAIVEGAGKAIQGLMDKAHELMMSAAMAAWNGMVSLAKKAWNALTEAVSTGVDTVVKFMKELPGKILDGLGKLGTLLLQVGKDLVEGLVTGIKAMAQRAVDAVTGVVGDAVDAAKRLLGIASPSKVFHEIGLQTMAGMVEGIEKGGDAVLEAARGIAKQVTQVVKGVVSGDLFGVDAADGEIARMLGGAKFGLDVQALAPKVSPPPKPVPKPKPRSDPNDVTYDRGPKLDPNDATVDRHPPPKDTSGYVEPSSYGAGQPPVVVNMPGAVIREEADIGRLGADIGMHYSMRGNI